jgi:hypothetical protein
MKPILAIIGGGLMLAASATARPPVVLFGRGFYDKERVVLSIFADSAVQLRSSGIRLTYNPDVVERPGVVANQLLWFLSAQAGQRSLYTPTQIKENVIRIVGGRFQGDDPKQGVSGREILLATLIFTRVNGALPSFQIALAGPAHYASFVTIDGTSVDREVDGLGTLALSLETLPEDSDRDGIPDSVELTWFGNLIRANATTDNDGDGTRDLDEWIGGTNAADPNSVTRLVVLMEPDGSRRLTWNGQSGRVYDLLKSVDLGPFVPLAEGLTEQSSPVFDAVPFERGFYRLRTSFPAGQ